MLLGLLIQGLFMVKETGQYRTIFKKWFRTYDPAEMSNSSDPEIFYLLGGWFYITLRRIGIMVPFLFYLTRTSRIFFERSFIIIGLNKNPLIPTDSTFSSENFSL